MASSDFWHQLADEFLNLPDAQNLSAQWTNNALIPWIVVGSNYGKYSFEALARRAGSGIAGEKTYDLLSAWLDALIREHLGLAQMKSVVLLNPDKSVRTRIDTGHITGVCEASANLCKILESRTLQSEFEQKKRKHRNIQGLVHRRFEAMRQDMKSRTGEPKQLPEIPPQLGAVESETESVGKQLNRLREECRLTAEELAELIDIETRSVQRHLAGHSIPYDRHLRAYEREFSKLLNRKVVVRKWS